MVQDITPHFESMIHLRNNILTLNRIHHLDAIHLITDKLFRKYSTITISLEIRKGLGTLVPLIIYFLYPLQLFISVLLICYFITYVNYLLTIVSASVIYSNILYLKNIYWYFTIVSNSYKSCSSTVNCLLLLKLLLVFL